MATKQPTSGLRAYVRGVWIAIYLQLGMVVVAGIAVVWLGWIAQDQRTQITLQSQKIETQANQFTMRAQALEALTGLPQSVETGRLDDAIVKLASAFDVLRPAGTAGAASTDPFWRPLGRALARLYHLNNQDQFAIATMQVLAARPSANSDEMSQESISLAEYYCSAGQQNYAEPIVTKETGRDPASADSFGPACRTMFAALRGGASSGTPVDPAYKVATIYMQIPDERQRAAAIVVAGNLCTAGYAVPGIELVPLSSDYLAAGDVRYYYPQQQAEAYRIAAQVGRPGMPLPVRKFSTTQQLPQNRVEVWLPLAAGAAAGSPAPRGFSCTPSAPADAQAYYDKLVASLNSENREERLRAGQVVAERMRDPNDRYMVPALLGQLDPAQLGKLNANGRINVLIMLNLKQKWTDMEAQKIRIGLDLIDDVKNGGVPIGRQTRDCIASLRAKIAGQQGETACGSP